MAWRRPALKIDLKCNPIKCSGVALQGALPVPNWITGSGTSLFDKRGSNLLCSMIGWQSAVQPLYVKIAGKSRLTAPTSSVFFYWSFGLFIFCGFSACRAPCALGSAVLTFWNILCKAGQKTNTPDFLLWGVSDAFVFHYDALHEKIQQIFGVDESWLPTAVGLGYSHAENVQLDLA